MTTPEPPEPKFVTYDEVVARYEGTIPANRATSLKWRIVDVENDLMGEVPSLRKSLADIAADSAAVGDPGRPDRVQTLVIDKVLDLFRHPDKRRTSTTSEMDGFREVNGYGRNSDGGDAGISFTDAELNKVRLPKRRRPKLGTYGVAPAGF
jgi:hypothetical protein